MTREEAIERIKARFDKWALDDEDMKAIQTLVPELRESEDEKIIRAIIDALYSHTNSINLLSSRGYQMEDIEAYLENQKETSINWMKSDNVKNPDKPYIDKAGMFYTTDGRMCYASEIEKQRDENAKDSFERGIRVGMIRQQKEQKPIKWTDLTWKDIVELEGIINNVHYDFSAGIGQESFGKEVLERFRSTKGIEYLDEAEQKCWRIVLPQPHYAFEEGQKEQKSAECEDCAMYLSGECTHPNGKCDNVKSKQEWSEEDDMLIDELESYILYDKEFNDEQKSWRIKRLKSLRPQYHGDVTMTEAYKMGKEAGEASHWKPNEHQMTILKAVKDYVGKGSGYWVEALGSLIDNLEKLT